MDLNTGLVITCHKVTEIPITDVIIKAIKTMAYKQGFKSLKFTNQHRITFHDADWIAGVDYDDPHEDEDNTNEEHENNEADETDKDYKYEDEDEETDPEEMDGYNEIDPAEINELISEV